MATFRGKAEIFGMGSAAAGIAALSGYVSPLFTGAGLTANQPYIEVTGQSGEINGIITTGGYIECAFRFIPQGSSIANAKLAAGIANAGDPVTITGLPVVAVAGFTDAFNTDSGNTQPWFFVTGSLDLVNDNQATGVMTLRRYLGITSGTSIS